MSRIDVTIDRVVLHGVHSADRDTLVNGLKSELARLLSEPGAGARIESRRTPVLRVRGLSFDQGRAGHRTFGQAVARAITKEVAR